MGGKERTQGTDEETREGATLGPTAFLLTGTLALGLVFADVILSIYHYWGSTGTDLRWLLASIDLALVLTLFRLSGKRLSRFLVSMKLAVTMLFIIAILSIIGTILPGKDQVVESGWVNNPLYDFYNAIGLFDMYNSRWFLFLTFLLITNLSWCIYKRLRVTFRNAIRPRVDVRDSFIVNQPLTEKFPGRTIADFRRALAGRRYHMHQSSSGAVLAQKGRFSALASISFHLSLVIVCLGGILQGTLGWSEMLYIPDGDTVAVPHTFMEVTSRGFNVDFKPVEDERGLVVGYQPTDYSSDLVVKENSQVIGEKVITVNGPLRVRPAGANSVVNFLASTSVNFHQSAYDTTATGGYATILEVNYRPGISLILSGLAITMIGITIALFVPHKRIWAKVGESGELLVGGRTSRAHVMFARDFDLIKAGLGRDLRTEAGRDV